MKFVRVRLGIDSPRDGGLSLIEILVAMMIFAMVAVGIAYGLTATLAITRDNKSREVASNLAAAEIDAARSIGNPFDVSDKPQSITVASGDIYEVNRTTAWVTPGGASSPCGSAGGPLQYKRVTVTVTWPNMRSVDSKVISDTLLAPTTRINDPLKGTLLVSVTDWLGRGKAGITFTASSPAGSVVSTPTDADGCAFILQVAPGLYTVKLTNVGMLSSKQEANPVGIKQVDAGSSALFGFEFDSAAKYNVLWETNVAGTPKIPTNMPVSMTNSKGAWPTALTGSSVKMHPYKVGYQAIAGNYVSTTPSCTSVDPEAWDPDTRVSPPLTGVRAKVAAVDPGNFGDITARMGALTVAGGTGPFLTAVSQPDILLPGQPACASTMTYTFGSILPTTATATVQIALPFGSWRLFTSSTATGARTPLAANRPVLLTPGKIPDPTTGTFALDPRVAP